MSNPKRKISNFVLMPKIQLRYTYYLIALIAVPLSLLLTYSVYQFMALHMDLVALNVPPAALTYFEAFSFKIFIAIGISFVSVVLMAIISFILISHRFVGPMYVINKFIEAMHEGQYSFPRELRKDDEMKETLALLKSLSKKLEAESAQTIGNEKP